MIECLEVQSTFPYYRVERKEIVEFLESKKVSCSWSFTHSIMTVKVDTEGLVLVNSTYLDL